MPFVEVVHPWVFWALIPGDPVQSEIMAFKREASVAFSSSRALRSPAHITLVPPARLVPESVNVLDRLLREITQRHDPFQIKCQGFSSFPSGVIFADICHDQSLMAYEKVIRDAVFGKVSPRLVRNEHGFMPHITIAFRDLSAPAFKQAIAAFSPRPYDREWMADGLWRLDLGPQGWHPSTFHPFRGVSGASFTQGV